MQTLLDVILPVFLVIASGYVLVWRGIFPESGIDGIMRFTQGFAIPCLLFRAIATLDLSNFFDARLLGSFYAGAAICFFAGMAGARLFFKRDWEDCVAIGFCCLFSNSVLLGLPIMERAYGAAAMTANFAIISMHSPFCYGIGITVMEVVKARGAAGPAVLVKVLKAMFSNTLIMGVALGFAVNLSGFALPGPVNDALDLMVRAALPAALFGLGGVLVQYRPEGDLRVIFYVCAVALVAHPLITFGLGRAFDLSDASMRSAVVTGAMAPGVNAYIFANIYGHAKRVAASSVLLSTALTIVTAWVWLQVLP